MTSIFISDVHLSPKNIETDSAFKQFLEHIHQQTNNLYILGDLFDIWYGQKSDTYYQEIFELLHHYSGEMHIYFMPGNRDFLITESLCKTYGMTKLNDPHHCIIDGQSVLLTHGDLLCQHDQSYQRMRSVIQHPLAQQSFLHLPLSWRKKLASTIQSSSRKSGQKKEASLMNVSQEAIDHYLGRHPSDYLIHGHVHAETYQQHGKSRRIVMGSWQPQPNYLRLDHTHQWEYFHWTDHQSIQIRLIPST